MMLSLLSPNSLFGSGSMCSACATGRFTAMCRHCCSFHRADEQNDSFNLLTSMGEAYQLLYTVQQ